MRSIKCIILPSSRMRSTRDYSRRLCSSCCYYGVVVLLLAMASDHATSFPFAAKKCFGVEHRHHPNEFSGTNHFDWNQGSRYGASIPSSSATSSRIFRNPSAATRFARTTCVLGMSSPGDEDSVASTDSGDWTRLAAFAGVASLYWYLLVLGAFFNSVGLPVPDSLPMVPGWPVSDADLAPVLEDSKNFFYLAYLIGKDLPVSTDTTAIPRLAVFNFVEAWIFAVLPLLWRDGQRRLSRPVLLGTWLLLGINLTNAFLAPYLALTEFRSNDLTNSNNKNVLGSIGSFFSQDDNDSEEEEASDAAPLVPKKNFFVNLLFAGTSLTVVGNAFYQALAVAKIPAWGDFLQLATRDRSYLAFCIDPVLFGLFQPWMLERVKTEPLKAVDCVPYVGLILWLLTSEAAPWEKEEQLTTMAEE